MNTAFPAGSEHDGSDAAFFGSGYDFALTWNGGAPVMTVIKRFDRFGNILQSEQQDELIANDSTMSGSHAGPSLDAYEDGDMIVLWSGRLAGGGANKDTVLFQRLSPDGSLSYIGGQQGKNTIVPWDKDPLATAHRWMEQPEVALYDDGDFWYGFAAWVEVYQNDGDNVYGTHFKLDKQFELLPYGFVKLNHLDPSDIGVDIFDGAPDVKVGPNGNFTVVWWFSDDQGTDKIRYQMIDRNGAKSGPVVEVTSIDGELYYPSVTVDNTNSFVIVWEEEDANDLTWSVESKKYRSDRTVDSSYGTSGLMQVNTLADALRRGAHIATFDPINDYVAVWVADAGNGDVYARIFDQHGAAVSGLSPTEFVVAADPNLAEELPDVTTFRDRFIVTWSEGTDIEASVWTIDLEAPTISNTTDNLDPNASFFDAQVSDLTDVSSKVVDIDAIIDSGLDATDLIYQATPSPWSGLPAVSDTLEMTPMSQLGSPKDTYEATLPMPSQPGTEISWYVRAVDMATNERFDPREYTSHPNEIIVSNLGDVTGDGCIEYTDYLLLSDILEDLHPPTEEEIFFADMNQNGLADVGDLTTLNTLVDDDGNGNPGWCPRRRSPSDIVVELGVGWGAPGGPGVSLPVYLENDSVTVRSLFVRTQADTSTLSIGSLSQTPRSTALASRFFDKDSLSFLHAGQKEALLAGTNGAYVAEGNGAILNLSTGLAPGLPAGSYHVEIARWGAVDTSLQHLEVLPLRGKIFVPSPPPVSIVCTPVADTLLSPGDTLTFNTTLTNHSDSTKSPKFFIYGTTAGPDSSTFLAVDTTQILQLAPGGRKRDLTELEVPLDAPAGHYVFTAYVSDTLAVLDHDPFGFQVDSTSGKPGSGGNRLASSSADDMRPWRVLSGWFGYEGRGVSDGDGARSPRLPEAFSLSQNYPNPFNPSTTIAFEIPEGTLRVPVEVGVYDIRGRLVRRLLDEERAPGAYRVHWDGLDDRGRPMPSGVYLYRIEAGAFRSTRKMVIAR